MTTQHFYEISVKEVTAGSVIIADAGFTCISDGEHCEVFENEGSLFVLCQDGYHYLGGQLDDSGLNYVGFKLKGELH